MKRIEQVLRNVALLLVMTPVLSTCSANELPPNKHSQVTGQFTVDEVCPLFQSKRKRTNPGNQQTQVGGTLAVSEAITAGDTVAWVRVRTTALKSPLRWLSADCGEAENLKLRASVGTSSGSSHCSTANTYDNHALALSWQPAFCETFGVNNTLEECKTQTPARFDASHFTLHGLWPNKTGCGIDYGFCGAVTGRKRDKCTYPALNLDPALLQALGKVMPSAAHGTCLQRHEYWKHGTCRSGDENDYYRLSMDLAHQVNSSTFVTDFIQPNIGKSVSREDFQTAFDNSFGHQANQHVQTNCKNGLLVEIIIRLPKELKQGDQLRELLQQAGTRKGGSCGGRFLIDVPGH